MVWISKRELAYLLILKRVFGENPFNLGEALDILSLFGSKRIARKVLKRLIAKGFIEKCDTLLYRVRDLEQAFTYILLDYIAQRLKRYNRTSRGLDLDVATDRVNAKIIVNTCDPVVRHLLEKLVGFMEIRCLE